MPRRTAHLPVGIVFVLVGAGCLTAGLLHAAWLPESFLTLTGFSLADITGFVLLLGGLLIATFAFQRVEPPADVVPAEVAFSSRMRVAGVPELPVPNLAAPPVRPMAAAAPSAAAPTPAAAPAPRAARVPVSRDGRLAGIDEEIKELTRKISKAGVMLATGQISQQGYASFVDELKKERGRLEAQRVSLEMKGKP